MTHVKSQEIRIGFIGQIFSDTRGIWSWLLMALQCIHMTYILHTNTQLRQDNDICSSADIHSYCSLNTEIFPLTRSHFLTSAVVTWSETNPLPGRPADSSRSCSYVAGRAHEDGQHTAGIMRCRWPSLALVLLLQNGKFHLKSNFWVWHFPHWVVSSI